MSISRSKGVETWAARREFALSEPLWAGIVGAGAMGRWHAKAIKRCGGRLSAVMDIDPDAARRLAGPGGDAQIFSDAEDMPKRANLDVLHICTPLSTHHTFAELALDFGVNLLIEKPIAPTAATTERLLDKAADRGVLICPVHQFTFQDGVSKARELLPRIGRPIHLEATFCSAGGAGMAGEQVDAVVADILPHPLSLLSTFLPSGLPGDWVTVRPRHGEFRAVAERRGVTLSIFISMSARPTVCAFQILGTEGTIHLDLYHGHMVIEGGKLSRGRKITRPLGLAARSLSATTVNLARRAIRREFAYPGLRQLVSTFYGAVRAGSESPISRGETVAVARARDLLISDAGLSGKERRLVG